MTEGPGQTDIELLEAWRSGDETAGDRLVRDNFDLLWRFFRHRAPMDVSDLIQQTFLGCAESKDRALQGSSFRAYLLGIARRVLVAHLRRGRHPAFEAWETDAWPDHEAPSPGSVLRLQEQERLLLSALQRLDLDLQLVIELSYWEELTTAETATVLGVAPGTVRSRLTRARRKLADEVERLQASGVAADTSPRALSRWAHSIRWYLNRTPTSR
jgi:RNA polymerase sigma-70 factor (ECF subfamily)